jgi:hypothetical protein
MRKTTETTQMWRYGVDCKISSFYFASCNPLVRWVGHVAIVGEKRNAHKTFPENI